MRSRSKFKIFSTLVVLGLIGVLALSQVREESQAQVEVYEGDAARRSGYFDESVTAPRAGQPPQEGQPQLFWVRGGQRIFCANCNLLLYDTVEFKQVPAAQAANYYDDGTHGDDFPNDGVPSLVVEERDLYLGEYCWNNKLLVENYVKKLRELTAREAYDIYSGTWEVDEERSLIIPGMEEKYAGPPEPVAAAEDAEVTSIPNMESIKRDFIDEYEAVVVSRYQGYQFHPDYITYPPEIYGPRGQAPTEPQRYVGPPGVARRMDLTAYPQIGAGGRLAGPYDHTIGRARNAANFYGVNSPVIP